MKISKLFHWLYGILMLLPILVFIPNAFYYGFNEQAVAEEKTEMVPVYYQSNEVNSIDDLVIGNVYHYKNHYSVNTNTYLNYITIENNDIFKNTSGFTGSESFVTIYQNSSNNLYANDGVYNLINTKSFDFVLRSILNEDNVTNYFLTYIEKCNVTYFKEYQPLTTTMSITDSMSYAWNSVWQNDLFSWSYESFLAEPFKYIGNVFGLPNDNSIYYCLSYWLDISIIWLCFDLIMYVPLLVHRWIDKGVLE